MFTFLWFVDEVNGPQMLKVLETSKIMPKWRLAALITVPKTEPKLYKVEKMDIFKAYTVPAYLQEPTQVSPFTNIWILLIGQSYNREQSSPIVLKELWRICETWEV